jgi:hypothetical protein
MDNSMRHNGSKVASKFEKQYFSRLLRRSYSPDINLYDFWLFGVLKEILKNREFNSIDEIEEVTASVWNGVTFDDVQSVFLNGMSHPAWAIKTVEGTLLNK